MTASAKAPVTFTPPAPRNSSRSARGRFPPSPALQSVLSYVPGALFVSFVVPAVVSGGTKEWVGAEVAFAVARLTGSILWPIVAGTAAAWVVWAMGV